MRRKGRTGGSEMRVGDVWRRRTTAVTQGSSWLVTRVEWDGRTFGLVLEGRGEGTEVALSEDRFAAFDWLLVQEGSLLPRTG